MHTTTIGEEVVPSLGFGTWQLSGDTCYQAVRNALETGYRHIDTARMYGNELEVGRALADVSVPRAEVFLATKLWIDELEPEEVRPAATDSLERLGTDHLDLLMIHWPAGDVHFTETLAAMAELREAGLIRHVGVSNFPSQLLAEALEHAEIFCDQVEYHPLLSVKPVLDVAREHDVLVTAYAPLAHGRVVREPVLHEIAAAHDATPAQVALAWLIAQDNVVAIPRSSQEDHIEENWRAQNLELTSEERRRIDDLARDERVIDPPHAPAWD